MSDPPTPEPISEQHELARFDSGISSLDEWLRNRALRNEDRSRTYVVQVSSVVVGYYALAAGAIPLRDAPSAVRRNAPDPIPVVVLGRLAIDRRRQGSGLGSALLRDAMLRTRQVRALTGVRALLVHAISDDARRFYAERGFLPSPTNPMTLLLPESGLRG